MTNEKQQQAHDLYFTTASTQQEIADILDVSRKTINGWIRKNRWDEMKIAVKQMPSLILHDIYCHINALNDKIFSRGTEDRCPTPKEVGMLHRLLLMTKSIQKQHTGSYMEAFRELQLFIYNRNEELAMQLRDHVNDYLRGTLGDKEFMTRQRRKNNVLDVTANLAKQEMREQQEEQECNPDVTFCNNPVDPIPHDPLAVQTGCFPSPLAPEAHSLNQANPSNHANHGQECNLDVTFCNPTSGVPHLQGVVTPPTQHEPLAVQARRAASRLAEEGRTLNQVNPSNHANHDQDECNPNVTGVPHLQGVVTPPTQQNPLAVQTGCSPSPLAQDKCNPDVTLCNNAHSMQSANIKEQIREFSESSKFSNSDPNVTFCNPNEQPEVTMPNTSKVFTVAANGEITPPQNSEKGYTKDKTEIVTFPGSEETILFTKTMALPPHMRPSPFIDGDTVWVLDKNHIERRYDTYGNPWGPMKMSYNVRYYPDIDPANTKAA